MAKKVLGKKPHPDLEEFMIEPETAQGKVKFAQLAAKRGMK